MALMIILIHVIHDYEILKKRLRYLKQDVRIIISLIADCAFGKC